MEIVRKKIEAQAFHPHGYHQSQRAASNHHAEARDHNEGEDASNHPVLPSAIRNESEH
jgi:hypothetical protein